MIYDCFLIRQFFPRKTLIDLKKMIFQNFEILKEKLVIELKLLEKIINIFGFKIFLLCSYKIHLEVNSN